MKIIRNNIIPFKGFKAITIGNLIFVRKGSEFTDENYNHECIHAVQQKELYYIGFFIIYLYEYIINLFRYKDSYVAYRTIGFEQEAYHYQNVSDYLSWRKKNAWLWWRY